MMNIQEFTQEACTEIAKILGREVQYKEVEKLNGAKHYGLIILEPGCNVAPTLYLEPFFDMNLYTKNWTDTVGRIIRAYQADSFPKRLDMGWFKDFEKVRELIFYKLVNFEANKALLEDIPYTRHLDFAIIYCVYYKDDEIGSGSILIHNSHLEAWGCTTQDLAGLAEKNTPQLCPIAVSTMMNVLQECGADTEELSLCEETPVPMHIMTNEAKVSGAITILYQDALKNFADSIHSDVVILPSSVHEVILLPLQEEEGFQELRNMVYEVNRSQLAREDFLSDNIYLYRRDTDCIEIV